MKIPVTLASLLVVCSLFSLDASSYLETLENSANFSQDCQRIYSLLDAQKLFTPMDLFEQDYLMAFCCISTQKEQIETGNKHLEKALAQMANIPSKHFDSIESFVSEVEELFQKSVDFSIFTYDDFGDGAYPLLQSFRIKIDIVVQLSSLPLLLTIKYSLSSFQRHILHENYRKDYLAMIETLNTRQNNLPKFLEKQTIRR